ncbi:hypothetical protein, partial [Streptococcus pyogenes]|uniref:hypothetical protein n=1 Tax=Streptococcus pyogenes TaxID=1314 RepID=UPI003CD0C59D
PFYFVQMRWFKHGNSHFLSKNTKKDKHQIDVCLQSESPYRGFSIVSLLTTKRFTLDLFF